MSILDEYIVAQPKSKIKAGEGKNKGKYKFFNSSNVQTKFYDEYQYDKPALIFGTGGNASVHYCDVPFSTSTDCIVFYARNESVDLKLIYIFISLNMHLLESGFKGIGIKHISKSYIQNIEVKIPEKALHTMITKSYDRICDLIINRNKQLSKLDELVKARFVELFGDPYINDKNWTMKTFGDICTVRQGLQIPISKRLTQYEEDCYEYITVAYLHGSKDREYIKSPKSTVICTKDDILMTRTGNTGMVVTDVEGVFHNNFFLIDFDRTKYSKRFLVEYLNLDLIQTEIIKRAGTSTIPDLNHGQFYAISIYEPPIELQNKFATFVEQTDKSKLEIKQSLEKMELLKKALMQKYFG